MAFEVIYSRIWQAQFPSRVCMAGSSVYSNQTTLTAASLPSLSQEATQIPNVLPESTYDFLDKARSLHIDQVDLQTFHEGLPQYDEDGFMAELRALPDQDELEETQVPGTW
jgi:hypothetical protein